MQGRYLGLGLYVTLAGKVYVTAGLGLYVTLAGKVYVTAGLGGMSGAQGKAVVIAGCIGVIAEVSREALEKRHRQGWIHQIVDKVEDGITAILEARKSKKIVSIG